MWLVFFDLINDLIRRVGKEKGLSDTEIEKRIEESLKGIPVDKSKYTIVSLLEKNKDLKAEQDGSFLMTIPGKSVVVYGANVGILGKIN